MTVRLHAFAFANKQVVPIATADFVKKCQVDSKGLARISSPKKVKPVKRVWWRQLASNERLAWSQPVLSGDRV